MFGDTFGGDDNEKAVQNVLINTFTTLVKVTLLLVLMLFPLITLHQVKPPTPEESRPGNVMFEAFWENDLDCDVDLWVSGPGDVRPVGYSNKSGQTFNLLRDDLGTSNDVSGLNFENAYSRGLPAGEYIANVHMYRINTSHFPVVVKVIASVKLSADASPVQIAVATVLLTHNDDEQTAIRFRLDERGMLVQGSVNHLFRPLRSN